jgi:hypothetical protein
LDNKTLKECTVKMDGEIHAQPVLGNLMPLAPTTFSRPLKKKPKRFLPVEP